MIGALIIVFREVIEAGLIVGIVLAVTQRVEGRGPAVTLGLTGGLAGASLVAVFAGAISQALAGYGQELFNAAILAVAVVMLAWHNIWMAKHGRVLAQEMRTVGEAVAKGAKTLAALSVVVGIAVLREGSEVALFLYGIVVSGGGTALELLAGGVLGLVLGGLVSVATWRGLVKIPAKSLFQVTGALIAVMAAGMAAQCAAFLEKANVLTLLDQTAWDTSKWLSEKSVTGRVLHTLLGYTDQPSIMQVLVYVVALVVIFGLMRLFRPGAPKPAAAAALKSRIS